MKNFVLTVLCIFAASSAYAQTGSISWQRDAERNFVKIEVAQTGSEWMILDITNSEKPDTLASFPANLITAEAKGKPLTAYTFTDFPKNEDGKSYRRDFWLLVYANEIDRSSGKITYYVAIDYRDQNGYPRLWIIDDFENWNRRSDTLYTKETFFGCRKNPNAYTINEDGEFISL